MYEFLDHPALQGVLASFAVALVAAAMLSRTRFTWLAIPVGYATVVALTSGFVFSPLTATRKIVLLGLVAPFVGIAADLLPHSERAKTIVLCVASGVAAVWAFTSVLAQREGADAYAIAAGIALFVAALVALVLPLRTDGLRTGVAGLGLGVATGVSAVVSASVGFLVAGMALAASAGAALLVREFLRRKLPAGYTGALPIALLAGLFATGTAMLALLPWFALPLLLLVPAVARLPVPMRSPAVVRSAVLSLYTLAAAAGPIIAAWYAARQALT